MQSFVPWMAAAVRVSKHMLRWTFTSFTTGVLTSPNHPEGYPPNLQKTQTIKVKEGMVVSLRFTAFALAGPGAGPGDYLSITDGDGTTLMPRKTDYSLPADIISRTNLVKLLFTTDEEHPRNGWSVTWSAVTPGERRL